VSDGCAHFTLKFKREAVQLLESGSRPGSEIVGELGIARNQLYKWQIELRSRGTGAFPGSGAREERTTEIARLKRELSRVTEERDILRKGDSYRIVVSDLICGRLIWFGRTDRSEASMDQFYEWLGEKKAHGIRLAVMDMWKSFGNSTQKQAPQAAILFDKFYVMRHLEDATGRGEEKQIRAVGKEGAVLHIKGQKYTLLSNRENLTLEGRKTLQTANKQLNMAYLLKESFGQLRSYRSVAYARCFSDNWRAALKWQRLKPYEKFADMIERHWDGIAAFC
jgi:transposase